GEQRDESRRQIAQAIEVGFQLGREEGQLLFQHFGGCLHGSLEGARRATGMPRGRAQFARRGMRSTAKRHWQLGATPANDCPPYDWAEVAYVCAVHAAWLVWACMLVLVALCVIDGPCCARRWQCGLLY